MQLLPKWFGQDLRADPLNWGYKRTAVDGRFGRLAELWLCARYGWNKDVFFGRVSVGRTGGSGAHQFFGSVRHLVSVTPRIQTLRINRWARFGNSVIQLRNAIYMAELLGAQNIEAPEEHAVFSQGTDHRFTYRWSTQFYPPPAASTIVGDFFFLTAFEKVVDRKAEARIFSEHLQGLVSPTIQTPDPRVGEEDLVMHFRAGDVFDQPAPHPDYGQPPLCYYLSIVERHRPRTVWLVFENRSNPCIDAAERILRERGIDVRIQSGTLAEDIRVLMSARRLVASRGSFVPMIALLSRRVQFVHFFERGTHYPLRELGVAVAIVSDARGHYKERIMNGNWKCSQEQRQLMLDYPSDCLSVREIIPRRGH
jgi:hypothetical protein